MANAFDRVDSIVDNSQLLSGSTIPEKAEIRQGYLVVLQ